MRISDWSSDVCSSDLIWIMLQGWRIVTGRSRDSLMALVSDSLRATLIVGIATGMTFGGPRTFEFLSNDVNAAITAVVTGRRSEERRVGKEGVSQCRSRW